MQQQGLQFTNQQGSRVTKSKKVNDSNKIKW